jgi:hypothetical protein
MSRFGTTTTALAALAAVAAVIAGAACRPAGPATTAPPADPPPTATDSPRVRADLPEPVLSGRVPLRVTVPAGTTPENARPWFDEFSWQSFIALNWPADPDRRGDPLEPNNPAIFRQPPAGSVTVWGAYKEAYELFGQGAKPPTPWDSYEIPVPVCPNLPRGKKLLLMANKGGTVLDGVNEAFSFPLIDQNKNYAWTEVRFDKAQYEFIRVNELYLAKNLAAKQPISMPASRPPTTLGSLMLKATWREMTPADDAGRYYAVEAATYDPATKTCDSRRMGLVGFHIVQKLDQFPQWIWSSFEQVDNIERGPGAAPNTPISFNNGTASPATTGGWADRPEKTVPPLLSPAQRVPTQVTRLNPIPNTPAGASTRDVNLAYQKLLAGTVWRHYQLVITQWPTNPGSFTTKEKGGVYPQDCGQPFPENGCVNVALETYLQSPGDAAGAGGNSCMSCHYTAGQSDFSWVLQRRAR